MQKIFSSDGKQWKLVFFHNKTLPLPVKRNSHLGLGCTQEKRTATENLAHALKDILHMVISNDIPLKISLSYGCVSLVKG